MLLFTLLFTLSGPSPKSLFASAPRCCLFSHTFGLLLFSVYSTVVSSSCFLHHYLHFPSAVMSDKRRKTPVALTLQQRAEILRLCDQQVQWFMDCFVFICGKGSKYNYELTACAEMNLNFQFNDFCYFSVLLFFGTIVDFSVVFGLKLLPRWFNADSVHFTVQYHEMLIKVIFL